MFQGNEARNTRWWDPHAADYILEQILQVASEERPSLLADGAGIQGPMASPI